MIEWTPERARERRLASRRGVNARLRKTGLGNTAWVRFSRSIFKERGKRCEECGSSLGEGGKAWALHSLNGDHGKLDPNNFVLLCRGCHGRLNRWIGGLPPRC